MRGLQVFQTLVFGEILVFPSLPEGFARLRIGEPHREGEAPLERRLPVEQSDRLGGGQPELENKASAWVA